MKAPLSHDVDITVDSSKDACRTVEDLARIITRQDHFAKDGGGKLYFYKHGVYRPRGEEFIGERVKQIVEFFKKVKEWKSHKTRELSEYIRADAANLWERPPLNRINVENGILDAEKRQLLPHTPEFLSTIQLPVNYDPEATCPHWERFVAGTFPSDAHNAAWEIAAWLMVPHTRTQKALLLLGSGSNGKSTYLRGLIEFLGRLNTCSIALHKLESDRFASSRLLGKLANKIYRIGSWRQPRPSRRSLARTP